MALTIGQDDARAAREGLSRYEMIQARTKWVIEAEGDAAFQADYSSDTAYFTFQNALTALAFKLRWI